MRFRLDEAFEHYAAAVELGNDPRRLERKQDVPVGLRVRTLVSQMHDY